MAPVDVSDLSPVHHDIDLTNCSNEWGACGAVVDQRLVETTGVKHGIEEVEEWAADLGMTLSEGAGPVQSNPGQ